MHHHIRYRYLILGAVLLILFLLSILYVYRHRLKKLNRRRFQAKWNSLQKLCGNKKLWYKAVLDADKLLDEALKLRHYKGKSTGERLVAAQKIFSDNDQVWVSHKLKKRIEEENHKKLSKTDTITALSGFRQALKDLEALNIEVKPSGAPDNEGA